MKTASVPIVKDLVLIGGGHSHVFVLKNFAMKPLPGVRLTLICRDINTPYSGMLPGMIAGHYRFQDTHIDLGPLARFANARFYHDEVIRIDPHNRLVFCRNRPAVPYDVLSINIGSTPGVVTIPGAAEYTVPVKPISRFLQRWQELSGRVLSHAGPLRIAVVGAGAGGVEMLLAIQYRLQQLFIQQGRDSSQLEFHLLSNGTDILLSHNAGVRRRFRRILQQRRVHIHLQHNIIEVTPGRLHAAGGNMVEADEILWVTQASAAVWLVQSGLDTDENGFLRLNDCLQSTSHENIFGAGDIAAVVNHPRPKAGVFAVRQGPPLSANLRRALCKQRLKSFIPQREFLSLISSGDRYAIASRGRWSLEGRWIWHWKDWIDRRFMRKFNELPEMQNAPVKLPSIAANDAGLLQILDSAAMRCGGCGAKVGSRVLQRALSGLQPLNRSDVLLGLSAADDAAVVAIPDGKVMVHSVDFFRDLLDDPYLFGRIAANHCLNDLYAMGAEPQTALAIVTLPFASDQQQENMLSPLLQGATETLNAAGASLVGGHTGEGAELALGFAVNGLIDRQQVLRKHGARPGDRLILSKALGTGTLFAAQMQYQAQGRWIAAAIDSMLLSNQQAAACFYRHGATACTDVTGFGLIGHLLEMLQAATVHAELSLMDLPVLDGALQCIERKIFSTLYPQNLQQRIVLQADPELESTTRYPLLFDPQTAGGLLGCIPQLSAPACLSELHKLGYADAAIIGTITEPGQPAAGSIRLTLQK